MPAEKYHMEGFSSVKTISKMPAIPVELPAIHPLGNKNTSSDSAEISAATNMMTKSVKVFLVFVFIVDVAPVKRRSRKYVVHVLYNSKGIGIDICN